ncbi:hypothetical protein D3C80_1372860 [compost metagenome]
MSVFGVALVKHGEGRQVGTVDAVEVFIGNARTLLRLHDDRLPIGAPALGEHLEVVGVCDRQRRAVLLVQGLEALVDLTVDHSIGRVVAIPYPHRGAGDKMPLQKDIHPVAEQGGR